MFALYVSYLFYEFISSFFIRIHNFLKLRSSKQNFNKLYIFISDLLSEIFLQAKTAKLSIYKI